MSKLVIRNAELQDVEQIAITHSESAKIYVKNKHMPEETWKETFGVENLTKEWKQYILDMNNKTGDKRVAYVAEIVDDGGNRKIIAASKTSIKEENNKEKKQGYLQSVYVHPEFQKKGVGTFLYNARVSWLLQNGCTDAYTEAILGHFSPKLFEKLGATLSKSFSIDAGEPYGVKTGKMINLGVWVYLDLMNTLFIINDIIGNNKNKNLPKEKTIIVDVLSILAQNKSKQSLVKV